MELLADAGLTPQSVGVLKWVKFSQKKFALMSRLGNITSVVSHTK